MFLFGQMNIKDQRIDKMLAQNGIPEAVIFYSPVQVWLYLILMGLSTGIGIFVTALTSLWLLSLILVYLSVSYLLYINCSHSFALTGDTLYILNPSRPFRRFEALPLEKIHAVTLGEDKSSWLRQVFIWSDVNFLQVASDKGIAKYPCIGLELDAFDENFTAKTLDDLRYSFELRNIPVIWHLTA